MFPIAALALLAGLGLAAPAQGQDWAEEVAGLGLGAVPARVRPGLAQAFFLREGQGCPRATEACRRPVSVPAGGEVVVSLPDGRMPAYLRAIYRAGPDAPLVVGPVASADLVLDMQARPLRAEALAGSWTARIRREENRASLTLRPLGPDSIEMTLESDLADAAGVPLRGAPRRELTARLRITTDPYLTHAEPGRRCMLRLIPAGRHLVVIDEEDRCADGGATLRFTGLYLRPAGPPAPPPPATPARPVAAIPGFALEPDRSRAETGSVYRGSRAAADATAEGCATLCLRDRPCQGFTLQPGLPGVRGAECLLLQAPGTPQPSPGAVSALRLP